MVDQPELDLPPPAPCVPKGARPVPKRGFGGFTRGQILLGAVLLLTLVWAIWVTKALIAPERDHIVKARLSSIVGDYVAAQARSASPPAQVEAEMRAFMASLDQELQRRGAQGQLVLVGEAVLTKNVPDITDSLKSAVYASGITPPKQIGGMPLQQQLAPQTGLKPFAAASNLAGTDAVDPMSAIPSVAAPGSPHSIDMPGPQDGRGASVATFGGPHGSDAQ
jgi:hypothetical protein